jgi:hypothetical protein
MGEWAASLVDVGDDVESSNPSALDEHCLNSA